jgi:tetratricopeptide (TPR) repeat protein
MSRVLKPKAFLTLAAAALSLGLSVHLLHGFQVRRTAEALRNEAARAESDGRPAEALECLYAYLALQPKDSEVGARLGLLLARQARSRRERQEACLVLEQVLRADGDRPDVRREAARLQVELEHFADARNHLAILLEANPGDAELELLAGYCDEALEAYEQAAARYARVLEHPPGPVDAYGRQARLLRDRLGLPEQADAVIRALIEAHPRSADARLAAARYYSESGRWPEAEPHLDFALSAAAPSAAVHAWAAEVALAQGRADRARAWLRQGLEADPDDSGLRLTLARLELQHGSAGESLEVIRPLLGSPPLSADDQARLAGLLIDLDRPDEAAPVLHALRPVGEPGIVAFLEAHLLARQGQWDRACAALAAAVPSLQSAGWLERAHLLLAECHAHLGNDQAQLAAYDRALSLDPASVPAHVGRGRLLARLGRTDEAIRNFRLAAVQQPECGVALVRLLVVRNLALPAPQRDWAEAEALWDRLPSPCRRSAEAIVARAELLAGQGRGDDARTLLMDERERQPRQVTLWLALAELADGQGQAAAAAAVLDEAEIVFPRHADLALARIRRAARLEPAAACRALAAEEAAWERADARDHGPVFSALGDGYSRAGDLAAAARLWRRAAEWQPHDLAVREALFAVAVRDGDDAEMGRLLDEIVRVEGDQGAFAAYARGARLLCRARRGEARALDDAQACAAAAAARRPGWVPAVLLQAQIQELQGRADEALAGYLSAVQLGERQAPVVRRAVEMLYERRRFEEAQALLRKLPEPSLAASGLGRHAVALALLTSPDAGLDRDRLLRLARETVPETSADYRDWLWLGQIAAVAGQPARAEAHFRRAAEVDAASPEPWVALAYLVARGDPSRAPAVLEEIRAKLPSAQAAVALAPGYELLGQVPKAQEQYELVLAAEGGRPDVLRSVAAFYARSGQPAKAEACLRRLLDLPAAGPLAAETRRLLAVVLAGTGRYDRCREALALLEQNRPAGAEDEAAKGVVLATQPARRGEAVALLEKAHQAHPLGGSETLLLVRLYEAAGDRHKALEHLVRLVETDESNPDYLARHVQFLLKHGYLRGVPEWLTRLEAAAPGSFIALSARVQWLAKREETREAAGLVRDYVEKHPGELERGAGLLEEIGRPGDAEPLYRALAGRNPAGELAWARYLARTRRADEALRACEGAWGAAPDEAVAETCLAVVRTGAVAETDVRRVDEWLDRALSQRPTSAGLAALRAELYFHGRRYAEAASWYRKVLEHDPRHVIALNMAAWLAAVSGGPASEALALVQRAVDQAGLQADLLDTRGLVRLALNQPRAAVDDLEAVLQVRATPEAYFHLAQAYDRSGDRGRAADAFQKGTDAGLTAALLHPLERPAFYRLSAALAE